MTIECESGTQTHRHVSLPLLLFRHVQTDRQTHTHPEKSH